MVFNGVTENLAYLSSEYENLIRIIGNDIPGEKKTLIGLTQIRGTQRAKVTPSIENRSK